MATGIHHVVGDVDLEFKGENLPPTSKTNGFTHGDELTTEFIPPGDRVSTNGLSGHDVNGLNGVLNGDARQNVSIPKKSSYRLGNFSIDEDRPIKVVVIGAGFSGIIAGIRFPQKIKNLDLTIYEKNAGVGGTWYSNKYPGLACDIPSHCYQLTFEENPNWSSFYAPGPEILAYLERVVDKYKVGQYVKLRHELVHAWFDEESGKWHLKIRRPKAAATEKFPLTPISPPTNTTDLAGSAASNLNGNSHSQSPSTGNPAIPESEEEFEIFEDTADFVLCSAGQLSRWSWPDIPGLQSFKGTLLHSANWDVPSENSKNDEDKAGNQTWQESVRDWGDKKVGVIGVGSSAIQIVPSLQPRVEQLYNFVRGKTWLAIPFVSGKLAKLMKRDPDVTNYEFSDEDRKLFNENPQFYKEFRYELESDLNSVHPATLRDTDMQKGAQKAFREDMLRRLKKKPWIAEHLIPNFSVACRRLTPGPGYLEALCKDNVDFVTTNIKEVTENGIELVDGKTIELDVLVCATGYETSYQYPFPVVGRNGMTLQEIYTPYPRAYLSMLTDGLPNFVHTLGPNSGVGSGSLLVLLEREVDYAVKIVEKMQRERIKTIEVKKEAVDAWDEYVDHYFPSTVYSEKCRSWYKMGKEEGRVVGLWPGSCLHAVRAMAHPRWEDYNYEYLDESGGNRLYWFGDGSTYNEKYMVGDRAWYLSERELDIPPIP